MASKGDTSEDDELPERWPDVDALSSDLVRLLQVHNEDSVKAYKNHLSKKSVSYPMKNFPRGNVLVINNERFPPPHQREGSEKDCQKITAVFNQLGFNVNVHNNLIKEEMEKVLIQASRQDYSNHDCFILFILSHGDKGVVHGIDSNSLSISYIRKLFCDNKWLVGKPKLFFIQACQGGGYDKGKTLEDEASTCGHSEVEAPIKQLEQSDSRHVQLVNSCDEMSEGEEITDGSRIPSEADTFVSLATVKGYASWRNTKCGSWYIQAIGYIFRMFAYKNDLNHLMILVNNLVSKCETKSHQYKQVATTNSTLTKTFYFFPCLHEPYVEIINKYGQESFKRQSLQEELDSVRLELKTITGLLDQEKSTRVNLKDELDKKKVICKELQHDLRMQREAFASLSEQNEIEKKERKVIEEYFKSQIEAMCPKCKYPSLKRALPASKDTSDIALLLIGKTGVGKSALGNTILRREAFISSDSCFTVTQSTFLEGASISGRNIYVADTPGFWHTGLSFEEHLPYYLKVLEFAMYAYPRGYNAIIYVVSGLARQNQEDLKMLHSYKTIFGKTFLQTNGILVVNFGDNRIFKNGTSEISTEHLEQCYLGYLMDECENRGVLFDNVTKDKLQQEKQMDKLFSIIDRLSSQRPRYTADHFHKAMELRCASNGK